MKKAVSVIVSSCFRCKKVDKIFDRLESRVFSLTKLITVVNLGLCKNIYMKVEKRDCKLTLFCMNKQTKTVKSCDFIILYTKNCRVLMSF